MFQKWWFVSLFFSALNLLQQTPVLLLSCHVFISSHQTLVLIFLSMICALECYQVAPYNDRLFEKSSEGGGGGRGRAGDGGAFGCTL